MEIDDDVTERYKLIKYTLSVIAVVVIVIILYIFSQYSYLLFHSIVEMFSIAVAMGVFFVGWNSDRFAEHRFYVFVGVSYLFISSIDLVHVLAYSGMGVFPGFDADLPTQLWITARYMESIALLISPLFFRMTCDRRRIFGYVLLLTIALFTLIFTGVFPTCYVSGVGLTLFKIISEYVIILILALAGINAYRYREHFNPEIMKFLFAAIVFTIGAEASFTLYVDVFGFMNMLGHFMKVASFFLIYKVLIEASFVSPLDSFFRSLKKKEDSLLEVNQVLQFTGRILRHDLKQDFSTLNLSLELFKRTGEMSHIDLALSTVEKSNELLDRLGEVEYTTGIIGSMKSRDIREAIQESTSDFHIPIHVVGDGKALADNALPSVFRNLIWNAEVHSKSDLVHISIEEVGKFCRIQVSDSGVGVPAEMLSSLFEQGFKYGETGRSGLGLYIVQGIITRYGGSIAVEPNEPSGLVFTILLPRGI